MHYISTSGERTRFAFEVSEIHVDSTPYDDRVGPTVLVVVLITAVIINFALRFADPKTPKWF